MNYLFEYIIIYAWEPFYLCFWYQNRSMNMAMVGEQRGSWKIRRVFLFTLSNQIHESFIFFVLFRNFDFFLFRFHLFHFIFRGCFRDKEKYSFTYQARAVWVNIWLSYVDPLEPYRIWFPFKFELSFFFFLEHVHVEHV